jgi:sugar PTS system EIIA component
MQVLAPCPGRVFPITIDPAPGRTTVVAPVAGTILKLHPHAFAMATAGGLGILVHLGINTVRLDGAGFELVATEGSTVEAGDPMVTWDPSAISGDDITTTVMVVVLDRPAGTVTSPVLGKDVTAGEPLFGVDD